MGRRMACARCLIAVCAQAAFAMCFRTRTGSSTGRASCVATPNIAKGCARAAHGSLWPRTCLRLGAKVAPHRLAGQEAMVAIPRLSTLVHNGAGPCCHPAGAHGAGRAGKRQTFPKSKVKVVLVCWIVALAWSRAAATILSACSRAAVICVLAVDLVTQIAHIAATTVPKPATNARTPAMRVCQ
jgi:hypothetical protein